ncbi:MAG: flagellar export protein FliJ [Lachnospiraceae bacterium]|jgi:flagellar FliJ protein|nr:flagellar export protein FliJ [Lachnospiraceae bacterium]
MAKFVYRMQNILELKKKIESQEKIAFSIANAKLMEEQEKLSALMIRRSSYEQMLKDMTSGELNIRDIKNCKESINTMKSMIRDQMLVIQKAQREVEIARIRLDEIMKDRKTHEKLREKAFENFKEELKQEESKETDQLVSFTYHNNNNRS